MIALALDTHAPLKSVGLVCECGRAVATMENVVKGCACGRVWLISVMQIGGDAPPPVPQEPGQAHGLGGKQSLPCKGPDGLGCLVPHDCDGVNCPTVAPPEACL